MPVADVKRVLLLLVTLTGCAKTDAPVAPPAPAPKPVVAARVDASPRPPRVLTIAATQGRERLMVVLHGVGSNADNMMSVAAALSRMAPDADVLVPDGLFPWSGGPGAREWYSLVNITDAERAARVEPAGVAVSAWLDEELQKRSLDGSKLIVVGFSQGAGIAEWLAVRRSPAPTVVALSGRFFEATNTKAAKGARALLVHGTDDRVVPLSYGQSAFSQLQLRGVETELEVISGLGHSVDERVLARVKQYLTR
ncbi:MAG: alpha/beta hydrolase [Archangium sp.]